MQSADDSTLLRQYAESRSNEAFTELVTRHINLVYSVAMRQVGAPHEAEEIAQAVFIILAKKAGALRHEKALSSWLFQATRLTANNFIRGEMRRHRREQEAFMQSQQNESPDAVWPVLISEGSAFLPFTWHDSVRPPPETYGFNNARNVVSFTDGHASYLPIYFYTNLNLVTCFYNPPAGYDYKWSAK